jgi:LL-diaminopimelate aminotransferase
VDTNVMAGHTGPADATGAYEGLVYLPCTADNNFVPEVPVEPVDVVYLCYPNNPTGNVATHAQLTQWVHYAREHGTLLLFDAAYEAYIRDSALPRSIYEIEGARECAIEFRSFSKNGGFTGTRCAYTVVPKPLQALSATGERKPLHGLWQRRMATKFNGVSYIVQRGAAALYTPEGKAQVQERIELYMGNAQILRESVTALGLQVYGGVNAPYLWVRLPEGIDSWQAFDRVLQEAHVVITPGSGFGRMGEGYMRISAFNSRRHVEEVGVRLKSMQW